jgi:hypothetical protein
MPGNVQMRDQVGTKKIEELMCHYDQDSVKMWMMKLMVIGMFLLIEVYG